MRILHTADWHLGAELKHVQRLDDQLARVEEVLRICDERKVDVLLVAGDFIDETRADRMTPILRRLGEAFRPRLERGLQIVVLAGNHDRPHVFPFLQSARDLFSDDRTSNLQFVWKPGLRVVNTRDGAAVRLMLLPYPDQNAYDLEAIAFTGAADRHAQMGTAVKQRIKQFESEIRKAAKIPTIVVAHLLVAGQRENGHELTEEADVPIPQVYLPNYPYVALGHVHLPTQIGSTTCRYSGSIERMDFGEAKEDKQVVLVELDKSGLAREPEIIALSPTELREIDWQEGADLVEIARGILPGTICKLRITVPIGTNVHRIQAEARTLIDRLCWPPEINWMGAPGDSVRPGSLALERADWQGAIRSYIRNQVPVEDPDADALFAAVEELVAMESAS